MSIYKRGKSWYIDITLGGHRIHRKGGDSKKEASDIVTDLKARYRRRRLNVADFEDDNFTSFADLAQTYFTYAKATKKSTTYDMEFWYYKKHVESVPIFKDLAAEDIDNEILLKLQANRKDMGLENRTINIIVGIVQKIMNHAIGENKIKKMDLKYPHLKEAKKLHNFLTFEEFACMEAIAELAMKRIIIGRSTRMRPVELAYLAWSDVHFDDKHIKIQGKKGIWQPRKSVERVIPMTFKVSSILTELYGQRKGPWVFSNTDKPARMAVTGALAMKRIIVGRNTGMRPAELAHLAWSDINFDDKDIKIQGKTGTWQPKTSEERVIPMNKKVHSTLVELYRHRQGPWVFSNTDMPVISIKKSIATLAKDAGIEKHVTPNMLRHTFATHSLMQGADLKSVQEALGHATIATTGRYLHSIKEHVRSAVELLDDEKKERKKK
jgi:integrase